MIRAKAILAGSCAAAGLAGSALAAPAPVVAASDWGSAVNVTVVGSIKSSCHIGGGETINFGELVGNQRATSQLLLDCNLPFDLNIQAAHGGLTHTSQPLGEGPFAGQLPYQVKVTAPTISPAPGVLYGEFSSAQLVGKATVSSGSGISNGPGVIEFKTEVPEAPGLLAGSYSETVSVTLSPRV